MQLSFMVMSIIVTNTLGSSFAAMSSPSEHRQTELPSLWALSRPDVRQLQFTGCEYHY